MNKIQDVRQQLGEHSHHWLVTGAAGFIGSNLVEALLALGQRVTGLDNFATGHRHNLEQVKRSVTPQAWMNFHFIEGDIRNPADCAAACAGVDFVLHQAALGSVSRSIDNPIVTNETNVTGFLNMLVAARDAKVRRFVYAASSSTYGDHPALPKVEDVIGNPLSPYAVTKYVNELYANVFGRTYGTEAIGLRYFNVFGPRQDPHGAYAAVIPQWVAALIRNQPLRINGDGETSRDFCYIANVVQANLLAAMAPAEAANQVYNVALNERTSLNQLYAMMRDLLRARFPHVDAHQPEYGDFRRGDVRHSQADIGKAAALLGYAPTHRIDEGLAQAMDWYVRDLLGEGVHGVNRAWCPRPSGIRVSKKNYQEADVFRISNHYVSKIVSMLLVVEVLVLLGAAYAGAALRFMEVDAGVTVPSLDHFFTSALAFTLAIVFSMSAMGMYQLDFEEGLRHPFLMKLMPSFVMGFLILTLVFYLAPELAFGRGILVLVFLLAALGIFIARMIFFKTSEARFLQSRIMFLGGGPLAKECADLAERANRYHRYSIAGFIPAPGEELCVADKNLLAMRDGDSLVKLARQYNVSEIVVSVQNRRGGFPIKELLDCKLQGLKVTDAATFFERETCQIRVDSIQPSWLVFGGGFDQSFVRMFMKRTFDLLCSGAILAVTFPLMLLAALAVRLEDRGPVFYSQERVGRDGKSFLVHKFRSMRADAEKSGKPQWAAQNDPRVTRVGNFMRKTRIDELPQILNVFKGEMSFVGPRPERPYFVEQLIEVVPYYNVRHSIKPGITGWAQVRYGYGSSAEDALQKLQYDLYYVKNNSLFLDFLVLINTLKVVLFRSGR